MYYIMYYLQQTEAEVGFWENYKRAQNYFIPVGHHLACNSGQVLPATASTHKSTFNIVSHCTIGVEIFNPPSSFSMLELNINKQYALFSK